MQTKVSTQGNVLLPGAIRRQLGIKAGDELYADIQNGNIVLTPERKVKRSRKANIVTSAITGLPVLMLVRRSRFDERNGSRSA
ncbi:MAG: AbrB/MazE/SpoVT family DNA-binding domain-containing protein [Acidobacteria bacterium]|nr:AbrB/MazE/SpoVT family DNA-binding domain-containing protein [Acidobacteriota bacterium]